MNEIRKTQSPWEALRRFTPARVALGRAGGSLPTAALLDFRLAHARARDALQRPLNEQLMADLERACGGSVLRLESRAPDLVTYLARPDLGRQLADESVALLCGVAKGADLILTISEGLSTLAVETHAPAVIAELLPLLKREWKLAPCCFVRRARVAVQDQVGEILGAKFAVILVGERPGLVSPDSLGAYMVCGPRIGNTDAQRNCISNINARGLTPREAAAKLHWLLTEARRRNVSGVELKDEFDPARVLPDVSS